MKNLFIEDHMPSNVNPSKRNVKTLIS
jgi:hypothetical protein